MGWIPVHSAELHGMDYSQGERETSQASLIPPVEAFLPLKPAPAHKQQIGQKNLDPVVATHHQAQNEPFL